VTTTSVRYGLAFAASLALSWTLVTGLIAMAFWSGPHTASNLARWTCLWVFTVGTPTVQALRLHWRLNDLVETCPSVPAAVRRDLKHTRFAFLMFGSMTVLTVLALELMP
jgi:hypothetical protein